MVTPSTVLDYDMNTKQRTVLKRQEVLGAFRAVGYDKAGPGAREVLLAWARGLLHPIQPPVGVALSPQRPRFPEEDPGA